MKKNHLLPRISVHPSFLAYLGILYVLKGQELVFGLLAALFVHEGAHLLVGGLLKNRYEKIELTPFGGIMTVRSGQSDTKGIKGSLIALSGPAANYISLLILCSGNNIFHSEWGRALFVTNTSMLCINLLPALPLDGGRIVFSIGYYFFPVARLAAILGALGSLLGGCLIMLSLISIQITGKLNLTLFVFGSYMIFLSRKEASQLLLANSYTALSEKRMDERAIICAKLFCVHAEQTLISLLPSLVRSERGIYATRIKGEIHFFDERELIEALLIKPQDTLSDIAKWRSDENCKTFC